jgi:hypothetical protein
MTYGLSGVGVNLIMPNEPMTIFLYVHKSCDFPFGFLSGCVHLFLLLLLLLLRILNLFEPVIAQGFTEVLFDWKK